jgi:uncharacterized protein YoxC
MVRAARFLVAPLVVAASLGSCGGGHSVATSSYVQTVCGALTSWGTAVQGEETKLSSNIASITSLQTGKETMSRYLDSILSDTNTMIDKVKAAGTPDVQNGSAASSELLNALTKLRDALESSRRQAASMSTSSPQAFQADAQRIASGIESSFSRVGSSLSSSNVKSPQLEQAFDSDPACKNIH